ncbi:MAG TPA: AMP-binding protein, partial [Bryobacteraceae bacterium]|nr:AMP-binding protein [Bryobacteraceae bacterium]
MHPAVHALTTPDKPAIIMGGRGETLSYLALEERSNQGAQLFRSLGLRPSDAIALFLENDIRFLEICWAAQRAGLYFTCISSRLTAGEAAYIVRDCGAKVLIASSSLAPVGELASLIPDVRLLTVGAELASYPRYETEAAAMPVTRIADETSGMDMLYSSGTTGRPKGVRLPLSGLPIDQPSPLSVLMAGLFGLNQNTIYLSPAPL